MKTNQQSRKKSATGGIAKYIAIFSVAAILLFILVNIFYIGQIGRVYAAPSPETVEEDAFSANGYTDANPLGISNAEQLRRFSNWYNQHADANNLNTKYFSLNLQLNGTTYWEPCVC